MYWDLHPIQALLDRFAQIRCPGTPPGAKLHVVVGVGVAGIRYQGLACLLVDSHVLFPHVAVNQDGLQSAAIRLQGAKNSGNDKVDGNATCAVILGPGRVDAVVVANDILKQVREGVGPFVIPEDGPLHGSAYGGAVKTKPPREGTLFDEGRQSSTKDKFAPSPSYRPKPSANRLLDQ